MGQACCAASENTPEIVITPEQNNQKEGSEETQHEEVREDVKEVNRKNQFYGKDGHKYSKTVTQEMQSKIDGNLEEYKKMVFSKQPTIP